MLQNNMPNFKIVFFGTNDFATVILKSLLSSSAFSVIGVITQPDEPVGRKRVLTSPPVKKIAESHYIPVWQPQNLKNFSIPISDIDFGIVAEYGKIIPKHILEIPHHGTLNVHTSLLPKYRGASPIQTALLNGETETGVTIMKMDEGMDTGPLLLQKKTKIFEHETFPELNQRLAPLGAEALQETLTLFQKGTLQETKQNEHEATYTKILTREDGHIDWKSEASHIYNTYRAFLPWPGIFTLFEGKRLKLIEVKLSEKILPEGMAQVEQKKLFVGAKNGSLQIVKLQLEGKNLSLAEDFIKGYARIDKTILG